MVAGDPLVLHARATDTLLHAEKTAGESNVLYILATLTDESGNILVDQNGETLVAFGETAVIVLHARGTDALLHAEATPILILHAHATDTLLHA